ncbi:hypothetical protein FBUS_00660 [Fasciolopsis buskii]|uniref:Uncharacterized protein n=1 Tax=Fasciolopsis buskii TaxID=27845 RepID=A0A8E0VI73_9TREM|nr:hypothetical protein FBUS_00660 [Fasciolopsis buski]
MQPGQFLENIDRRLAEQSVRGDRSNPNRGINFRSICHPLSTSKLPRTAHGTADVPVDNERSSLSPLPFDSGTGSNTVLTNSADHSTFFVTVDPESDLSKSLYEPGSITKSDHSNTNLCKMKNMESYNSDDKEGSDCNQSCSVILNVVEPSADMSTVNRFPNMSCGSCCCGTGCCIIYLDNPD